MQLKVTDSSKLFQKLNIVYEHYVTPSSEPELSSIKFSDIVPEFKNSPELAEISNCFLYKLQEASFNELSNGRNLILRAGTGSGKTEAWAIFSLKTKILTLAIYPTLALANDQLKRLEKYANACGIKVCAVDSKTKEAEIKLFSFRKFKEKIESSKLIITNPAFVLNELKKFGSGGKSQLFDKVFANVELIVLDEVDFYGPREFALLISIVKLISQISSKKPQIAILTATLENPREIAQVISSINGRECSIVEGEAFRVENRTYLILGKDLKKQWDLLRSKKEIFENAKVGKDIISALDSFETFKNQYYKVLQVAKSLGIELEEASIQIEDILKNYLYDEGTTIVFTRGIAKSEEIARKMKTKFGEEIEEKVATHHHLILKEKRKEIEEKIRQNKVKIVISPRTLSQGIDIGNVVRIVHVGLPESVREFYQKEGRKGRRKEIPFSETIIFPISKWDRDLLSRGSEALKEWLKLPLEKVIFYPSNKYMILFEALFKINSPRLKLKLTDEERELLQSLRLIKDNELTVAGKKAWMKMNFYEFAPPFGIKRKLLSEASEKYLEDISNVDLVEKLQPGCIDYTSDCFVTGVVAARDGRSVSAIVEEKFHSKTIFSHYFLMDAYEEYSKAKAYWNEEDDLYLDYLRGNVHSQVICVVKPPRNGFGNYIKMPSRVIWVVYSEKPRFFSTSEKTEVFRDYKVIEVPSPTYGKFFDFTYGMTIELDPNEDVDMIRIGIVYIMLVLRRIFNVPFETIMYDVFEFGQKKFLGLHEPESAGLLENMDWQLLRKEVESYCADELDDVLFESLNEFAYSKFISTGLKWEIAKSYALKVIDYVLLKQKIPVIIDNKKIFIEKPSRALKLASLDAVLLNLDNEEKILALGLFDGEEFLFDLILYEFGVVKSSGTIESKLLEIINQKFRLLLMSLDSIYSSIEEVGLKSLAFIIRGMNQEKLIIDTSLKAKEKLNIEVSPLEELEKALGIERKISIQDAFFKFEEIRQRFKDSKHKEKLLDSVKDSLYSYIKENCENIYKIYLILNSL